MEGDDGRHCERRIGDPVPACDAEEPEEVVEDPALAEDLAPEETDADRAADQRGHVKERTVNREALDAAVERYSNGQREHEDERHRPADIGERHPDRLDEAPVTGKELGVVVWPDPDRRGQDAVTGEAQVERGDDRNQRDAEEADQPGDEEGIGGSVLGPLHRRTGAARRDHSRDTGRRRLPGDGFDRHRPPHCSTCWCPLAGAFRPEGRCYPRLRPLLSRATALRW